MADITNDRSRIIYNNEGQAIFGGSNAVIWVNPAAGSHAGVNFRQDGTFKGFVGFNNSSSCVNLSMDGSIANGINVNSSHNVGIGLTSQAVKLEIKDSTHTTMKIRSGNDDNIFFAQAIQSSDSRIGTETNTDLSLYTNGTQRMRIDSGGSIDLGGNAIFTQFIKSNSSVRIDIDSDNNQTDRSFLVSKHNAGTELMRINEDGNIGVSQSSPISNINSGSFFKPDSNGRFLTINGAANGSFIMLETSSTTDNDQIGGVYFTATGGQGDAHKQVAGIDAIFHAHGTTSLNGADLRFFTKPSGDGAGVDSPALILAHNDHATFAGRTDLQKDLRIRGNDASGSLGVVRFFTDSNNQLIIDTGNDGSNRTIIDGSGNATFAGGIDLSGNFINIGNGQGHSENYLQIGHSRTGNGYAYIDLVGDTTYTDFGLRIIRGNTGANATSTIEHKGTGNFTIKTTEAANLRFQTSNTERMRIDTSGKVGIGITSPQQKIHIVDTNGSNIILNSNTGAENNGIWMTEGAAASPYTNGVYLHYDGANNAFKINTGTSSLTTKFTIDRDTGNATFAGDVTVTGGDSVAPQINLLHDGANPGTHEELGVVQFQVDYDGAHQNWGKIRLDTNNSSVRTNMEFYVKSTSGAEQVALTLEGQPSAVPNAIFAGDVQINGSLTGAGSFVPVSGGTFTGDVSISNANGNLNFTSGNGNIQTTTGSTSLVFGTNSTERMRIHSSGNVGIGVTSPSYKLDVLNVGGDAINVGAGNDFTGIRWSGDNHAFSWRIGGDSFFIYDVINAAQRVTIDDSGNFGIGTSSPSAKLHVNGVITANDTIQVQNDDSGFICRNSAGTVIGTIGAESSSTPNIGRFTVRNNGNIKIDLNSNGNSYFIGGNVGIGTTSPSDLLSLATASGDCVIGLTGNSGGDPEIHMDSGNNRSGNIKYGDGSTAAMFRYQHSDTAFKFYAHNQTDVDFQIGENTSFFASCNLGIGTSTPQKKVHIEGDAGASASQLLVCGPSDTAGHTAGILLRAESGEGDSALRAKGGIFFEREAANGLGKLHLCNNNSNNNDSATLSDAALTIKQDKKIGIGTTSPSVPLEISSSDNTLLYLNSSTANVYLRLDDSGSTNGNFIGATSDDMHFWTNNTQRVRITSTGSVGIGTTSPANDVSGLHIAVNQSTDQLYLERTGGATGRYYLGTSSNSFFIVDDAQSATRLVVDSSGNVLIGSTTFNTGSFSGSATGINVAGAVPIVLLHETDTDKDGYIGISGSTMFMQTADAIPIRFGTSDTERMRITSSGNIGIGNTSPSQKLHVTGSVLASSDVVAFSDIKLKENIKTLDGSKVYDMRGVSFTRKDTGKDSSGVIAQEIQKIAPELVTDNDGTLSVAYGNLTGYLIEAVKELKTEVEQLKKQIKNGNNL